MGGFHEKARKLTPDFSGEIDSMLVRLGQWDVATKFLRKKGVVVVVEKEGRNVKNTENDDLDF